MSTPRDKFRNDTEMRHTLLYTLTIKIIYFNVKKFMLYARKSLLPFVSYISELLFADDLGMEFF